MSNIDKEMETSEALIGFILAELYKNGLRSRNFTKDDFIQFSSDLDKRLLVDIVIWMCEEKLIYMRIDLGKNVRARAKAQVGMKVEELQLSSKGIQLLKNSEAKDLLQLINMQPPTSETPMSSYTKLGSLIGGLLGGFTKSIS